MVASFRRGSSPAYYTLKTESKENEQAGKYPKVLIFNYPKKPNTGTAQMDFFRRNGGAKFNCVGYDGYIIDIVW
jgi:hypothetical protein